MYHTISSSIPDNTNSRSSDTISTIDPSTQKTINTIRDVASNIREAASSRMRDVVRAARQSGAIDDDLAVYCKCLMSLL